MRLAQIVDKCDTNNPKAEKHWTLVLENLQDCQDYMEFKTKRDANQLWDFAGDRELKGKGNNAIGILMDSYIKAQPEGTQIHLGQLAFQVDSYRANQIKGFMKILDRGSDIRVSAAGGYCHLDIFHVVRSVKIDKKMMYDYMNDRSDEVLTNKVLKMYDYLDGRTLYVCEQEITISEIKSMTYNNWYKEIVFNVKLTSDQLPQHHSFGVILNDVVRSIDEKYFKTGYKITINFDSVILKQAA